VLPGRYRVVVPSGRLRPPQGLLGQNSDAAPIITVIADALERPQQNMPHRYVKPNQHPDLSSRLCSKSTYRNLFAGRDVIGPMEHRRRPVNKIVSPTVLPDRHAAAHPAGTAHPLARGTSTKRVPSFPFKNWR
jgi:hypothetical protein